MTLGLEEIRTRCIRGENLSLDETRILLQSCRRGYVSAVERPTRTASATKKAAAKPKATMADLDKLLGL